MTTPATRQSGKLLETQDLVTNFYTYEGVVKALNKVSLVVEHGSTFGLVGESGCGKSVTVRSILRIVQEPGVIESGQVVVFLDKESAKAGLDLLKQSETFMEELRGNSISMIFQEPNAALNPIMSIGDQVAESLFLHQTAQMCGRVLEQGKAPGLVRAIYRRAAENPKDVLVRLFDKLPILKMWRRPLKAHARQRVIGIMARLGIANPERIVDMYPHNLSGGMKQRIVIAIALACNPVLLIADEATSNLDVTIQAQILELLSQLKEEIISSILLITHDLGVVAETCDKVGVMYAGNLVEVAEVEELFERPLHPYTRALLEAVPKLTTEGMLQSIPGNVPNLVHPPTGCRFHPRCSLALESCRTTEPDMLEVRPGHLLACPVMETGVEVGP